MAAATTTTLGEIVLAGDLTGEAQAPELVATGVTAGSYKFVKKLVVDSKGRLITAAATPQAEVDALVDAAYASDPSAFTIVEGRPVLNIPDATDSVAGLVTIGSGISVADGVISVVSAEPGTPGTVFPGFSLQLTGSALSVDDSGLLTLDGGVLSAYYQFSNQYSDDAALEWFLNGSSAPASGARPYLSKTQSQWSTNYVVNINSSLELKSAGVIDFSATLTSTSTAFKPIAYSGSVICLTKIDESHNFVSVTSTDLGASWSIAKISPLDLGTILKDLTPTGSIRFLSNEYEFSSFTVLGRYSNTEYFIGRSTDGLSWSWIDLGSAPLAALGNLCSNGTRLLSCGYVNGTGLRVTSSTNGTTWTTATGAASPTTGASTPHYTLHNGSVFVSFSWSSFLGSGQLIFSSSDGITWTNRTASLSLISRFVGGCVVGSAFFIAGITTGNQLRFYHSTNGSTWTTLNTISAVPNFPLLMFKAGSYIYAVGNGSNYRGLDLGSFTSFSAMNSAALAETAPFPLGFGPTQVGSDLMFMTPHGAMFTSDGSEWRAPDIDVDLSAVALPVRSTGTKDGLGLVPRIMRFDLSLFNGSNFDSFTFERAPESTLKDAKIIFEFENALTNGELSHIGDDEPAIFTIVKIGSRTFVVKD